MIARLAGKGNNTLVDHLAEHRTRLTRLALRLTRNREDAEDLVQETLLRAYERAAAFRPERGESSVGPYLAAILRNLFCNHWQKRRRCPETTADLLWEEVPETRSVSLESAVEQRAFYTATRTAIEQLPQKYRQTMTLALVEEMTYEQIAQQLDLPMGTVRSCLHRARKRTTRSVAPWLSPEQRAMVYPKGVREEAEA